MTSYVTPKKGFPFICYVGLVSQSTGQFQSNPTLAAGDFKISKDGAALANLATLPAVTPASSKSVKISLDSDETNADNLVIIGSDAAGAEWDDIFVNIQTTVSQIDDLFLASSYTAPLSAAGTRSAIGLASANLDTQLDALPTAAENADAIWDEDATGHQTQGTFGQAIGDPVADTNTIYKAVVTDATGATVGVDVVAVKAETASIQTDTNDIQTRLPAALVSGRMDSSVGSMAVNTLTASALASDAVTEIQSGLATSSALTNVQSDVDDIQARLPAALSGDGFMKADLKSIDDETTDGNNATLNLKKLNIINNASSGVALLLSGSGTNGRGVVVEGIGDGIDISGGAGGGYGVSIAGGDNAPAVSLVSSGSQPAFTVEAFGTNTDAIYISGNGTGKSINAPQDISVSDGDLTLSAIAKKILTLDWTTVTGEAARSVLNALRKLRNKVSYDGVTTLTVTEEDDITTAYTQTVTTDSNQQPFKELG